MPVTRSALFQPTNMAVDPVVAGSSPVALAKQKWPQAKDLRLLSFPDPLRWKSSLVAIW
jgi:hypothetical protein